MAPGKEFFYFFLNFFAGCPGWHPANYYYFFVFLTLFFVGTCYGKYIPISKFGTIMSFFNYISLIFSVSLNISDYSKFELQVHEIMEFGHSKNSIHDI